MLQASITVAEVTRPISGWCDSGHHVPPPEDPTGLMERGGQPGNPKEPIRFFQVSGQGINGTYCEPCLIIANHRAREAKRAGRIG